MGRIRVWIRILLGRKVMLALMVRRRLNVSRLMVFMASGYVFEKVGECCPLLS